MKVVNHKTKDDWSIRSYDLYVNDQFFRQLLYYGDKARIISPEWIIEEFKKKIDVIMKNYESSDNSQ